MSDVSASREMDCWRGTAARGSGSVVSNSSVSLILHPVVKHFKCNLLTVVINNKKPPVLSLEAFVDD